MEAFDRGRAMEAGVVLQAEVERTSPLADAPTRAGRHGRRHRATPDGVAELREPVTRDDGSTHRAEASIRGASSQKIGYSPAKGRRVSAS